jgi:hypothetical protein
LNVSGDSDAVFRSLFHFWKIETMSKSSEAVHFVLDFDGSEAVDFNPVVVTIHWVFDMIDC